MPQIIINKYGIFVFCIGFCFTAANSFSQSYTIYSTLNKTSIDLNDLATKLAEEDFVFFGEQHDDSLTHVLQRDLFKLLVDKSKNITLSMEMFETDVQYVVDEYLDGLISEKRFLSASRSWSNYEDYKPLVELAKDNNLPVIAANAPRRYVSLVSSSGQHALKKLSKTAKKYLPKIPVDTLSGKYYQNFVDIMGGAAHFQYSSIYHAQCLWDATMAHSIWKHKKKNKNNLIYHLCGHFHSDEHLGTIEHLKMKSKKLKIANISVIAIEEGKSLDDYVHLADYLIVKK